ncbi:hypothetical protein DZ11F43_45250 [Escherichia coli]
MSTGLRFTLEVDGLPPDAFAVVSFHLNQSLSSLFSLDLSLVSQQFLSLEFAQVLDKMAYLTIWQGDEVQRRVKGVVTWFELGENDKNQMLYSMKVHPPLWRAGLRQNFRIFQNEDIKSILGTMLQENGVTEWSPLFSEPHPSREFCVQYGETDYDFLCRMAAEEGIFFYEDHAYKSTDQSLVLCDTVRHLPESFEIPWNPNTRTEVSTLCISQFRYSAQIRPSSVVTKDYTFKRPGWAGRFDQEGQHQDYQRTQYEVYDYPGRFKGAHGQNFARWQMDGWRNNAETARGMSRSPEIWPGRRIVLTGHPQANLNREWQVVASELHGEQPQAVPGRQGAGTALENHFAVIPADRTWRPQPLLKPLVDGPQSAVVTGPALVCYDWTPRGELAAVYDRSGTQMRHFTYDDKYRGRMVGHRYAGRPEMRYRYDDAGRVVEQLNPAGLSYRYQYEQDRITVTDSLNRREVLHTEGGAGLKRVVKKELADGSVTHSGYDAAGRLMPHMN